MLSKTVRNLTHFQKTHHFEGYRDKVLKRRVISLRECSMDGPFTCSSFIDFMGCLLFMENMDKIEINISIHVGNVMSFSSDQKTPAGYSRD